jgi:hypothetical protein
MTPGQTLALFVIVLVIAAVVVRHLVWRVPRHAKLSPLPTKTHIPVTDGATIHPPPIHAAKEYGACREDGPAGIELTVKIFGGPDNGEEFVQNFSHHTQGFLEELAALRSHRKMKSKVFLALDPVPHVLVNRGLFLEFDNDHVAKPSSEPRIAPSPFRRRRPGQ